MEEAFKMRNLLEEFLPRKNFQNDWNKDSEKRGFKNPTILGFREHIFTGRCLY